MPRRQVPCFTHHAQCCVFTVKILPAATLRFVAHDNATKIAHGSFNGDIFHIITLLSTPHVHEPREAHRIVVNVRVQRCKLSAINDIYVFAAMRRLMLVPVYADLIIDSAAQCDKKIIACNTNCRRTSKTSGLWSAAFEHPYNIARDLHPADVVDDVL